MFWSFFVIKISITIIIATMIIIIGICLSYALNVVFDGRKRGTIWQLWWFTRSLEVRSWTKSQRRIKLSLQITFKKTKSFGILYFLGVIEVLVITWPEHLRGAKEQGPPAKIRAWIGKPFFPNIFWSMSYYLLHYHKRPTSDLHSVGHLNGWMSDVNELLVVGKE